MVCVRVCVCGFLYHQAILGHQLGVLQFNSTLTLPRESIRFHRWRAQSYKSAPHHQTLIANPGYHLCVWPAGCRLDGPTIPPPYVCLILLEWLTEFRETFYSLDYWFNIKGCNSATARWKRGQGLGKGYRVRPLWAHQSTQISTCSPTRMLSKFRPFEFLWRLHYMGM